MAHTLQDRYSRLVLAKLRANTVFRGLFNKRYEGSPKAGAVKIPVRDTEVTVGAYNKSTGGSLSTGSTSYQTLSIDKDQYVNELIDGYEAAAVPDNLVADRLDSAGYALAKDTDDALVTLLTTSGNYTAFGNTTALTKSTVYDSIVDAVQAAKALGVDASEMWLAVPNDTFGLIMKAQEFIRATDLGDVVVQNGLVGRIAGVNVYETNNIPSAKKVEYILGNRVFCHFVDEWAVPVGVSDLKDGVHIGASAVQGRRVYGSKVSRPTTVLIKLHA